jgi:2'-5' RNA ligase
MKYQQQQKELIEGIVNKIKEKGNTGSTIVEMRDDYENDDAICLTSVVFLNEELRQKVRKEIIEPLKEIDDKHYFYKPDSLHLTIKNIRTIHKPLLFNEEDVKKVKQVFSQTIPSTKTFEFELKGLVRFPTSISLMGYSDDTLYELVSSLDGKLKEAGVPDNKKYASDTVFFGNITICRFATQPSEEFLSKVEEFKELSIGKLIVDKVSLIKCNAVCSPVNREIVETYHLSQ